MWKPGESGNPDGRPKGSRNKLGEDFIRALCEDFEEHGAAVIATVRESRPHDYLKIVASLLRKQIEVDAEPVQVFLRNLDGEWKEHNPKGHTP